MRPPNERHEATTRLTWTAVVFLFVLAAAFRAPELGRLGFFGDEELTAFSAKSLATSGEPRLPSGLEYRRAYAFTWANAQVAQRLGAEEEASYRIVSAFLGSVTPPVVFLVAQPLVGPAAALLGATLLAGSEWHVAFSRLARMYGSFLLFYVLAGCWLWRWSTTGTRRYAWLGLAAYALAGSLHVIGVFALGFALAPLALGTAVVPAGVLLATVTAAAALTWLFDHIVVLSAYGALTPPPPFAGAEVEASAPTLPPELAAGVVAVALVYLAVRALLVRKTKPTQSSVESANLRWVKTAQWGAGGGALALAGIGLVGGAATAFVCWLLLQVRGAVPAIKERWIWIAVGGVAAVGWTAFRVRDLGFTPGLKEVLRFPYPYTLTLAAQLPFMAVLAAVPFLTRLNTTAERSDRVHEGFALVVILSLVGIGVMTAWGPSRYVFHVYPFVLLLAGIGLAGVTRGLLGKKSDTPRTVLLGSVLALSGVLGAHGIPDAWRVSRMEYGQPVDPNIHMYPLRPDHEGAGQFLRDNLEDGDIVVAEDVQQQRWYAGQADYMLRSEGDVWPFLFADAHGTLRDVYVGAELLWTHSDFDRVFSENSEARVWIVTSAETHLRPEQFLNGDQRSLLRWLGDTGAEVFLGRDGVTRVYCVGCSRTAD